MALVLITPLIVMVPPLPATFFPYVVGKALYSRTLIEIAFAFWLVLAIRSPEYRISRSWVLLIFAVYVGIALLASLSGVSPQRSLWSTYERMQGFVDLAHWFVFIIVIASVFRSWPAWRTLLNINLAIAVAMGLLGLAEQHDVKVLSFLESARRIDITLGNPTYVGAYMLVVTLVALAFLGHSLLSPPQRVVGRERDRGPRRRGRRRRASGVFSWQEGLAPQLWMWQGFWAVSVVLGLAMAYIGVTRGSPVLFLLGLAAFAVAYAVRPLWTRRAFWAIAAVVGLRMIELSVTRGAFVGLVAGLLAFGIGAFIWGRTWRVRLAAPALAVLSLTVVWWGWQLVGVLESEKASLTSVASSSRLVARLAETGPDDSSARGRLNSARIGLRSLVDDPLRPLLGWGPENFTIAYDRYVTGDVTSALTESFDQAHNKLVEELTTKGILGFAAYVAIWLAMLGVFVRRVRHQSDHDQVFTLLAGAGLAGYFVQNLFLFDTPGTVGQFYLLMGFVVYLETAGRAEAIVPVEPQKARAPGERQPEAAILGGLVARLSPILSHPAQVGASSGRRLMAGESPLKLGAQLAVATALLTVMVYFMNLGPYAGSRAIIETVDRSLTWDERLEIYDEAITAFEPLANYPRLVMFNQLAVQWRTLNGEQARKAIEAANREGLAAMESEPEEWRIYDTLAGLYQRVAASDADYAARARLMVNAAQELAPERIEIQRLLARQYILEKEYEKAHESLDRFEEKYPEAAPHFEALRKEIDRVATSTRQ